MQDCPFGFLAKLFLLLVAILMSGIIILVQLMIGRFGRNNLADKSRSGQIGPIEKSRDVILRFFLFAGTFFAAFVIFFGYWG